MKFDGMRLDEAVAWALCTLRGNDPDEVVGRTNKLWAFYVSDAREILRVIDAYEHDGEWP
jgi:hypothetical protein